MSELREAEKLRLSDVLVVPTLLLMVWLLVGQHKSRVFEIKLMGEIRQAAYDRGAMDAVRGLAEGRRQVEARPIAISAVPLELEEYLSPTTVKEHGAMMLELLKPLNKKENQ